MTSVDQHRLLSNLTSERVPSNGAASHGGLNQQRHIVVVNDTQEILDLFRDILEEEGYRVSLYSYAFQDIAEIQELQPHLVILDFVIGGEAHGWQLLQKMKMTRDTMDIPVIVCTAALQLARELGGHLKAKNVAVVLKPFDIDDLLKTVAIALDHPSAVAPAALPGPL
jgi:DNA-binding NtrC family response regulator